MVDGFSRLDIHQGTLGDCWFIAGMFILVFFKNFQIIMLNNFLKGMVAIANVPHLFAKVVPEDQSFSKNYCGNKIVINK